jgi:hypothetical protein
MGDKNVFDKIQLSIEECYFNIMRVFLGQSALNIMGWITLHAKNVER